jgi:hypothetical protein
MTKMFQNRTAKFLNFLFNALWVIAIVAICLMTSVYIKMLFYSIQDKPVNFGLVNSVSIPELTNPFDTNKIANSIHLKKDIHLDLRINEINYILKYSSNFKGFHLWYVVIYIFLIYSMAGLLLIFIFQLKKIFNLLMEDKVFVLENITRIRYIGISLISFWAISCIFELFNNIYFRNYIASFNQHYYDVNFNFERLLPGLIALILAQVFKYGYDLQVEKDLTI